MEIIKHGDVKQRFEAKCCNCGCEFVADRTETYTIATPILLVATCGAKLKKYRYTDCPDCGQMVCICEVDMQGIPIKTEEPTEKKDEGVGILGGRIQGCVKIENCPPIDEKILKESMVTTADIAMTYNDIMRRREEDNLPWWKKALLSKLRSALLILAVAVSVPSCTHTLRDDYGIIMSVKRDYDHDNYLYNVTVSRIDQGAISAEFRLLTNRLYQVGDTIVIGKPCSFSEPDMPDTTNTR